MLLAAPKQYSQPKSRVLSTPQYTAYVKIAEGCSNRCSYCAIPKIRGPYRSRPYEEIVEEVKSLVQQGTREVILVAQDTTQYGIDLYHKLRLSELLRDLNEIPALTWIRILYCYPESFSDELIETMAQCKKVCHYVDLPLQHASNSLLKTMRRRDTREQVEMLLANFATGCLTSACGRLLLSAFQEKLKRNSRNSLILLKKNTSNAQVSLPIHRKRKPRQVP